MTTRKTFILFFVIILLFVAIIFSYFFPGNIISKIICHINSTSTIVIMVLTLVYVLTTNMQLFAMKEQIEVMNNEINLQSQPIPIPKINNIFLEKIRPFCGPNNGFKTVSIMSRLFCDISLENIGNGAALNIVVFPVVILGDKKIPSPSFKPNVSHCLSEKNTDKQSINLMMYDNGVEIARSMLDKKCSLELNIFYKNIFGKGFHEYICYKLYAKEGDLWRNYLLEGLDKYAPLINKYNALKPIDKNDAKEIFEIIKNKLEDEVPDNLNVEYKVSPQSYSITIINYEQEVRKADATNEKRYKEYFIGESEWFERKKCIVENYR